MAKKNENRVLVPLVCEECKTQNYTVSKNKKNTTERLELNKYCPRCRKNTTHKEKKTKSHEKNKQKEEEIETLDTEFKDPLSLKPLCSKSSVKKKSGPK